MNKFSAWASGALAWNREETRNSPRPPNSAFWAQLLACVRPICICSCRDCLKAFQIAEGPTLQAVLKLTPDQQRVIVGARRRLLQQLAIIRQQREKVVLSLGLALLQKQPVRRLAEH